MISKINKEDLECSDEQLAVFQSSRVVGTVSDKGLAPGAIEGIARQLTYDEICGQLANLELRMVTMESVIFMGGRK